jgi:hypothetical protein
MHKLIEVLNLDLNNRHTYQKELKRLTILPMPQLTNLVETLYKMRYEKSDIRVLAYHRLASSVLLRRNKALANLHKYSDPK